MDKSYLYILFLGYISYVYATIRIIDMRVPESIPLDGNVTDAEFDCIYEAVNETGLEVKWFFNGEYQQIYQWLPGFSKAGSPLGMLKNRIDLNHTITDDKNTEYRGFKINNITQDLSGNYTCKISSDTNEASGTRQMIIYSPADSGIDIALFNNDGLVICTVFGISPKPEVDFYILAENGTQIDLDEDVEAKGDSEAGFNITARHDFTEYNHTLTGPTKFVCNVSIPGTTYFLSKELIHLADDSKLDDDIEDEKPVIVNATADEITNVTRNEIQIGNTVTTTHGDNAAVHLSAIGCLYLVPVLLMLWK